MRLHGVNVVEPILPHQGDALLSELTKDEREALFMNRAVRSLGNDEYRDELVGTRTASATEYHIGRAHELLQVLGVRTEVRVTSALSALRVHLPESLGVREDDDEVHASGPVVAGTAHGTHDLLLGQGLEGEKSDRVVCEAVELLGEPPHALPVIATGEEQVQARRSQYQGGYLPPGNVLKSIDHLATSSRKAIVLSHILAKKSSPFEKDFMNIFEKVYTTLPPNAASRSCTPSWLSSARRARDALR